MPRPLDSRPRPLAPLPKFQRLAFGAAAALALLAAGHVASVPSEVAQAAASAEEPAPPLLEGLRAKAEALRLALDPSATPPSRGPRP